MLLESFLNFIGDLMVPVFSATSSFSSEQSSFPLDLQLLPDEDLLNLWEQTQKAVWAMEDSGWDADPAQHYGQIVVWEMQRRVSFARSKGVLFGGASSLPSDSEPMPHIMTISLS